MEARRSFVWRGSSQSFRGLRRRPKLATLSLSTFSKLTHSLTLALSLPRPALSLCSGVVPRRICTLLAVIPPPFGAARPFHPVLQRPPRAIPNHRSTRAPHRDDFSQPAGQVRRMLQRSVPGGHMHGLPSLKLAD